MATLLDTIFGDDHIAKRLAEMPSDAKTITLSLADNRLNLQHPEWSDDQPLSSTLHKTVDEPLDVAALRADEGFIPPRKVISLGQLTMGADSALGVTSSANPMGGEDVEYRLIGKLGSGGTGIVYQAHQRAIDREVAVKVLRHELAGDRQSRHRFLTEARVIGSLDHPNVIALHDLCIDADGHLFYAMKRIDGTSWDQQIDQFSVEENLTILLRVADAIRYAHSRGLIHRDIKPENVMLGRFGEALVADWGLAIQLGRSKKEAAPQWCDGGSAIGGTPAYMAPEQASGGLEQIGPLTDVYLLGAILFQVLTGRPPHHGNSLLECIHSAANNIIVPTEVVGELMDAAMKAMATDPRDRYATVEEFVSAITDHRTHQESERLVRRAKRRAWPDENDRSRKPIAELTTEETYERFRISQALLHEAIELWPENTRATETLKKVQLEFARFTAGRGDLDLSLRLYAAAGEGDCEAAVRVRRDRDRRDRVRESHAKYSALFTQSPEAGLLIQWADGVVLEANKACLTMLGYEEGELVGREIAKLAIWNCDNHRQNFVETLTQDGHIENFETRFLRKSGDPNDLIDVLISARTVSVSGSELLLSTIRDITQRRDAERNLEQSRRRLRDLQSLAGLGTWSFDPRTKVIQWSSETFRLAGRDPAKGEPDYDEFLDQIHPEDRDKLHVVLEQAIETGSAYQLPIRQRDDDGNYRSLLTRGRPAVDDQGNTFEVYGIVMPGN
ncbi:protein kinase domain-containing protein [Rhodopirellula sallentina]|uniref:Serine/threonine-protein kinase n=1 Tax=Rhodopirellula sallentina SM41 TaxID=1263870 RepID=M5U6U3_9BACT|nr:protein kinase [Rhodopirellula sallentina]EMI53596.1 serine/threonine-protein kinase [Rhodopirellula sallentina SM41]